MKKIFTADVVHGEGFEIELHYSARSTNDFRKALMALWDHRTLKGCFLDPTREPWEQPAYHPVDDNLNVERTIHWIGTLPNGEFIPLKTNVLRLSDELVLLSIWAN